MCIDMLVIVCRGKDLKRQTLLELVDYVNNPGGQKIFTEALMPDIMAMVVRRICVLDMARRGGNGADCGCWLVGEHLPRAAARDGGL